MSFAKLNGLQGILYRGSHGPASKAVMNLAIGPARMVAIYIEENKLDVADNVRNDVAGFFSKAIRPGIQSHVPGVTLADRVGHLLDTPAQAGNHFTVFEHVLYEAGGQINSTRTGQLLESTSESPRTAILYAYGIDPAAFENGDITFCHGKPNNAAFVAIISRPQHVASTKMSRASIAAVDGLTVDEAARRILRDREVLLTNAVQPEQILDLPPFNPKKPKVSLNRAAAILCKSKAATY